MAGIFIVGGEPKAPGYLCGKAQGSTTAHRGRVSHRLLRGAEMLVALSSWPQILTGTAYEIAASRSSTKCAGTRNREIGSTPGLSKPQTVP